VTLARNNDKFVQIIEGINDGERTVLNPLGLASMEKSIAREKKATELPLHEILIFWSRPRDPKDHG